MRRRVRISAGAVALAALAALPAAAAAEAKIDAPAPAFTLSDTSGKTVSLSDYKGKLVVLEWINHDCPFVKKHYDSGNLPALQKDYTDRGVVWLSINSSAAGKQGHCSPAEADELSKKKKSAATSVLLDSDGTVGRLYGAKTTPHMYVIDAQGVLRYAGAIDSISSPDPADIEKATNYVRAAVDSLLAGDEVATKSTQSYGCSIKY